MWMLILYLVLSYTSSFVTCFGVDYQASIYIQNNVTGVDVKLNESSVVIQRNGFPIKFSCQPSTSKLRTCVWFWADKSQDGCTCLIDNTEPGGYHSICKDEVLCSVSQCDAQIVKASENLHRGDWNCNLDNTNPAENRTSWTKVTMEFLKPIYAIESNATGVLNLKPNEESGFQCSTQNAYPAANFYWSVTGQTSPYPHEQTVECSTGNQVVCTTTSKIRFKAPQISSNTSIVCNAIQTDSYGNQNGMSATIIVLVDDGSNNVVVLKGSQIAGIVVGILLFFIILILFILAYICGWCCFAGGKNREKRRQLEVHDAPKRPIQQILTATEESSSTDDDFYRPQIPPKGNRTWRRDSEVPLFATAPVPSISTNFETLYKYDPYDNEKDVPMRFNYEGDHTGFTPANSLSSLASSHCDFVDFGSHLKNLLPSSDGSSTYASDSELDSQSSDETLRIAFREARPIRDDNLLDNESWV